MSRESHNDVVTRQGMSDGDARLLQERRPLFLALLDVFRKYLIIRAFWQRCNIWQSSHILLGHWVLCYFAIEHYAHWPLSIMLLCHWALCSLGFSHIFLFEVSLLRSGTRVSWEVEEKGNRLYLYWHGMSSDGREIIRAVGIGQKASEGDIRFLRGRSVRSVSSPKSARHLRKR